MTVVVVVKLTGDSLSDYVSNSIIKAAGAKGGTGSIFAAPIQLFLTAFHGIVDRGGSSPGLSQLWRQAPSCSITAKANSNTSLCCSLE